jgi:hypothetical protein
MSPHQAVGSAVMVVEARVGASGLERSTTKRASSEST